jgi:hypothetical protein
MIVDDQNAHGRSSRQLSACFAPHDAERESRERLMSGHATRPGLLYGFD